VEILEEVEEEQEDLLREQLQPWKTRERARELALEQLRVQWGNTGGDDSADEWQSTVADVIAGKRDRAERLLQQVSR
jgi:hypothetical protein